MKLCRIRTLFKTLRKILDWFLHILVDFSTSRTNMTDPLYTGLVYGTNGPWVDFMNPHFIAADHCLSQWPAVAATTTTRQAGSCFFWMRLQTVSHPNSASLRGSVRFPMPVIRVVWPSLVDWTRARRAQEEREKEAGGQQCEWLSLCSSHPPTDVWMSNHFPVCGDTYRRVNNCIRVSFTLGF